jgi:hypothetical protein
MRLNGWQRIGIVAPDCFQLACFPNRRPSPTTKQDKQGWHRPTR